MNTNHEAMRQKFTALVQLLFLKIYMYILFQISDRMVNIHTDYLETDFALLPYVFR